MQIKAILVHIICLKLLIELTECIRFQHYTKNDILQKREEVREMFQHAYDGYLTYATGFDELRPLTCDGVNTWGSYSLTLIDALDTLVVMGNYSEFRRVVNYLVEHSNFDSDINVSVFETNIRIVGGLLSAHLMSRRAGLIETGWPCNGPLLRMAEDVAKRLLPAFDTNTGMPYGTVNLRHGVPAGETSITCTAGVGTFLVEFGALSRLTGDPIYEEVALNAVYALWKYRSPLGLFGNHIDVQTGRWTAQDAGIGAGVDSLFEYLVKGAIMLNRPDLLEMFHESRRAIDKHLKKEDWYVWVSMNKGHVTLPVFQSLEAFWPGLLSLIGDIESATRTFAKYHSVWSQYGFLPEFYNIPNGESTVNRESYPLRPELIESAMLLYRATNDQFYLEVGDDILTSIQHSSRTKCGYATIKNIRNHERDNRMESFFLAETTKYLYLLFDPENFLHNDGSNGKIFETPNGECIIEAGNYIFNTEAHPIDPSALHCCHDMTKNDIFEEFNSDNYIGEAFLMNERKRIQEMHEEKLKKYYCPSIKPRDSNITIDLEFVVEIQSNLTASEKFASQIIKEKSPEEQITIDLPDAIPSVLPNKKVKVGLNIEAEIWEVLEKSLDKLIEDSERSESLIKPKELANLFIELMKSIKLPESNRTTFKTISKVDKTLYDLFVMQIKNSLLESLFQNLRSLQQRQIHVELIDILTLCADIILYSANKVPNSNVTFHVLYQEIFDIIKDHQQRYEDTMTNVTIIYEFIVESTGETSKDNKIIVEILEILKIIENKLIAKDVDESFVIKLEIFENFIKFVDDKKYILQALKNLESFAKEIVNDDLIQVKEKTEKIGVGTIEPISEDDDIIMQNKPLLQKQYVISESHVHNEEEKIGPKIPEQLKSYLDDNNSSNKLATENASILSEFFQSILKSTIPAKPPFDPQELLEKIRNKTNSEYMNFTQNWEVFSCKAQTFLQKLHVEGIFY